MLKYISVKGGGHPVDFETAILDGFASDGGSYVPEQLPEISLEKLEQWKHLGYQDLAFEVLSLFIDRSTICAKELKVLIDTAYETFEKEEVIPIHKLQSWKDTYIMELFYGPTLSFKDIGLAFLVNLFHFFLERKQEARSIIVATTGDTGPATASFIAGKPTLDAWVLYPKGLITEEQERQMTTLPHINVHPIGVFNCPEGGDDLDAVVSKFYTNKLFKNKVKLSSVNSINWGRIMIQTVHFIYGYFQVMDTVGEEINMAVPSGGFGNLCASGLARKMGLPIKTFIVANNRNACLHRIFSKGVLSKEKLHQTVSSAIDILHPINFWRYLYFSIGKDANQIRAWADEFEETGIVDFDRASFEAYKKGFTSISISDEQTIATIRAIFETEHYLLDPHGAIAVAAADLLEEQLVDHKLICLATAHPAKFPKTIRQSLDVKELPTAAIHPSIEVARKQCQKGYTADHAHLEEALLHTMESYWQQTRGPRQ
ncbi:MAG: threonine synthase [Saprospiraceae bacterium]|nr:threonine synthase [Saprospiraceae bacterium]